MAVLLDTRTGPVIQADGAGDQPLRQGRMGSLVVADGHGKYFEQASRRNVFFSRAIVTAPVIFTTAAGTGGPFLWNGSTTVVASILAVGWGITTANTVAASLGITGGSNQAATPTATTAADSSGNMFIGGPASNCTSYRVATPSAAGTFFIPLAQAHTGALTVDTAPFAWVDLSGLIVVPPNCWAAVAASATMTSAVMQIAMIWEEVPF